MCIWDGCANCWDCIAEKLFHIAAAVEITESFRSIEPDDPVKYDFALSRVGILDNCTGRHRAGCEFCELFRFCSRG